MTRIRTRSYSRYTRQALALLGALVRAQRKEKRMTTQELADRAGISRDLLYRIEKGDPRCELGAAFEVAAIVGIQLFGEDAAGLKARREQVADKLTLLPGAVRRRKKEVHDDF